MNNEEQLQKKSKDFNLIQIPEVITANEAKELIQFHKTHSHLLANDVAEYYNGRKIPIENIRTQWIRDLMRRIEFLAISEISKKGFVVFPEQIEIMRVPIGTEIPVHNDVYELPSEDENIVVTPKSEWAGVLYLNQSFEQNNQPSVEVSTMQNYKGGHLRFEPCEELPMGFEYIPVALELVLFQGMDFFHSVSKVYRNDRYTIPMWFTTDYKDIRPEFPTQ